MEIYTIGFTRKSAAEFFDLLKSHGTRRLVDVRLNNRSQLAGFTKRDDLAYLLREICDVEYVHEPLLAPTQEILDAYKKRRIGWNEYERRFMALMHERGIENEVPRTLLEAPSVLLCSEPTADHCHRRLVVEYLDATWGDVRAIHL